MRILVTDATGILGRQVCRELLAAGHAVSGIATRPHHCLDPHVDFVCGSLRAPILHELAHEADAVLHLAPVDPQAPGSAGIPGVVRVSHVAARAGARLLFVSAAAGEPALYRQAEMLVSTSWAPHLVIRAAPPMGRQLDWMVCRTVVTLVRAKASSRPIRVLHIDDLVRFLVMAIGNDRTGVVDLATSDATNTIAAWRLLRSAHPTAIPPWWHRIRSWTELSPEMNIAALQEDWNFELGWSAAEALADTARGLIGRKIIATGAVDLPGHVPLKTEAAARIELSARTHPRSATPMTLDVQLGGLCAAIRLTGQVLGLDAAASTAWECRASTLFAHRIYLGVAAAMVTATRINALAAAHTLAMLPHLKTETKAYRAAAIAEHRDANRLAGWSDATLEAHARLIRDRIRQGWCLTALWLVEIGVTAALQHHAPSAADASALYEINGNGQMSLEITTVAAMLRADPQFLALALTRIAHRGPGEIELAQPTFGDDPTMLLAVAADVPDVPATPTTLSSSTRMSRSDVGRGFRELAYDATLRFTHQLRIILREIGSRRFSAGQIGVADDVFYLTFDELVAAPRDIRLRITQRRTERACLPSTQLPDIIDRTQAPFVAAQSAIAERASRRTIGSDCASGRTLEASFLPKNDVLHG
ncbi:MAG: NAD-dependent epimerase/dehydratase family protein [Mycobacteriaceae bacterium]|nr:NAD-dependent epimerase/dehydratase family protein [Mycobacteriaceae bacterium]